MSEAALTYPCLGALFAASSLSEPSSKASSSMTLPLAVRRATMAVRARLAAAVAHAMYAHLAGLASASSLMEPLLWVPSLISLASAMHRCAIRRARVPRGGGRCLFVVGVNACQVRAPCGARPGLVSVGAITLGSGLDGGGRCLVVVGGGAYRVRAPCGARLGLVVDAALVVGPFVDLIRMLSWAPPASFPWLE